LPHDPESTSSAAQPPKRSGARLALGAGAALGALVLVLAVLFVVGVPLPGEYARAPLESLLSKAFGVPTRIEGPLTLRTGLVASAQADALTLADPLDPGAPPLARATRPSVRIDLVALLRRAVKLDDIEAERLDARLARAAGGRGNWAPLIATSGGTSPVTFAGIGRLRIASVEVSYRGQGGVEPLQFQVKGFDGTLAEREPATARGTLSFKDRTVAIDASSASLADLLASAKSIPLQATIDMSGARLKVNGDYVLADAALEGKFELAAENADKALGNVGLAAHDVGKLDARGRLRLTAVEASVSDLAFRLGEASVEGSVGVNWGGERPRLVYDLAGERVNVRPFIAEAGAKRSANWIENYVEVLDALAHRIDLDGKVAVGEYVGFLFGDLTHTLIESRIANGVLAVRANGDVLGMHTTATIDYSAREPKRVLTMHMTGGRFSTKQLSRAERSGQLSGTLGGLRFEVKGAGASTQELAKSIQMKLDSRDVRFTWAHRGASPTEVTLDSAHVEIAQGRSAWAEVKGKLGGRPCSLKVAGGTLESLLDGERWPLRLNASCRGAKLASTGHVVMKGPRTTGELQFDASANPIGPFLEPLGLSGAATLALAAGGKFSLTEDFARLELDQIRLGHSGGVATVAFTLDGKRPHRVKLALKTVDVNELATLAPGAGKKAPVDPLAREVLPAKVHLPDLDLELSADVARLFGDTLRRVRIDAATRDGALPPTRFAFDWHGAAVAGEVSADFRSAQPTLELSATTQNVDLGAALARAGYKEPLLGAGKLRAGMIKANARGAGVKLGELLGSATAEAVLEQGQLKNVQRFLSGLAGDAKFSAKLVVTEGQPVKLSATGAAGDTPFDVAIETATLTQLAQRKDQLPGTLRASLGETRLEASGNVAREGSVDVRLMLSGKRLDRLGRLGGAQLPEVGPYAVAANLVIAPDSIRASNLDVKFGKSRLVGAVSVKRGSERLAHIAELRAPILHLEDLGLHLFVGEAGKSKADGAGAAARKAHDEELHAQVKNVLRSFDVKATLDVEKLHSEGQPYASVKLGVTLSRGDLHVALQDVHVEGGTAQGDLRLDASGSRPRLRVRIFTKGFEYGPLAKALKPKTPQNGTLDLSFDLATGTLSERLYAEADGHVDVAVYPRGLDVGAADYWGTGLLHFVQRNIDPSTMSQLNCAVAVFDVKGGVARSEAFFADTTRVRIIGELEANLGTRRLSGRLSPRAKNPQLFSVAPTVGISGTMEAPRVQATAASLITTPLRLFAPLHTFAFDWLTSADASLDGAAGCRQAFERAGRADIKKPAAPSDPGKSPDPS
jgi:uncharacterized protein involved in outer membrane biogenesis